MKKLNLQKKVYILLGLLFAAGLLMGISYLIKSNSQESEVFSPETIRAKS